MPYRMSNLAAPKALTLSVGWVLSAFIPIAAILLLTVGFIVADFIVGIIVSYRIRHVGFTTLKAWRTAFKFAGAMTAIVSAYAIEVYIFKTDSTYFSRGVAGILCGFDFYSLLANFAILSHHPVFRVVKKFVKSEIESKTQRAASLSGELESDEPPKSDENP